MNNKIKVALMTAAITTLVGCAYKPPKYNDNYSKAYNIATAGGLYSGVSDSTKPRKNSGSLTDSNLFGATYGLAVTAPVGGNLTGGLLGLATWAVEAKWLLKQVLEIAIAWMPSDLAENEEEARLKLLNIVEDATITALAKMGAGSNLKVQ